jgi:hypothetical protein
MEHDNQELLEQMLLSFEALVDVAKRVCERYGIGDRGTPGSARSGDQAERHPSSFSPRHMRKNE